MPNTNQTNQSIIQNFSSNSEQLNMRSCLKACNLNPNCNLFAVDMINNNCVLYSNKTNVCGSSSKNVNSKVYVKSGIK